MVSPLRSLKRLARWPKGEDRIAFSRPERIECEAELGWLELRYSVRRMVMTRMPIRIRESVARRVIKRFVQDSEGDRVETVYRTVVDVGRFTESIFILSCV